ncbi:MAG: porin [Planctomycetota bacterium]
MRALIKAQGDKLDRQEKILEEQERLIRQQKDWLERQSAGDQNRPPASGATGENGRSGPSQEISEAAFASDKSGPQQGGLERRDHPLTAYWGRDGRLMFRSEDRKFQAHIGAFFQFDYATYAVPSSVQESLQTLATGDRGLLSGTDFRRMRLRSDGLCWECVEWVAEMDFSRAADVAKDEITDPVSNVYLNNVYIGIRDVPILGTFRIGHIKEELSFYCASSGRNFPFMERPMVWDAIEDPYIFDNGITLNRNFLDDAVYLWMGLFQTNTRTGAFTVSPTGAMAYDIRTCLMPILDEDNQRWMCLGFSGSVRGNPYIRGIELPGSAVTVQPLLRAGTSQQVPTLVNSGRFYTNDGTQIVSLNYNQSWGPLSLGAMYDGQWFNNSYINGLPRSDGSLPSKVKSVGDLYFDGFSIEALYFLTPGDHRTLNPKFPAYGQVLPARNFRVLRGGDESSAPGIGAWEVTTKFDFYRGQFQVPDGTSQGKTRGGNLNAITLGLNWFLNPNASMMMNYVYTTGLMGKNDPGSRDGAFHSFGTRFQFTF